jgi:hypothetical protein
MFNGNLTALDDLLNLITPEISAEDTIAFSGITSIADPMPNLTFRLNPAR